MTLDDGEPEAGPWRVEPLASFVARLLRDAGSPRGRPPVVAVDGRSSSGKTTLAARIEAAVPGAATVHTDDVAWWHSAFGWDELLIRGVLEPARHGEAVAFRPPAWDARGRPGAIGVPAGVTLLILEGVGAARRETARLVDTAVFVQSDRDDVARRNAVRVAAGEIAPAAHERWMAEEVVFVADQRPWVRASVVVSGTPELPHDPTTQVVVAPPPHADGRPGPRAL